MATRGEQTVEGIGREFRKRGALMRRGVTTDVAFASGHSAMRPNKEIANRDDLP